MAPAAVERATASASGVLSGGVVLGIASTVVTPPARAAAVPVAKSSLCSPPGTRRWVCTSARPGSVIVVTVLSPGKKKARSLRDRASYGPFWHGQFVGPGPEQVHLSSANLSAHWDQIVPSPGRACK